MSERALCGRCSRSVFTRWGLFLCMNACKRRMSLLTVGLVILLYSPSMSSPTHFVSTGSPRGTMLPAMCFASISSASFISKSSPKSSDPVVAITVQSEVSQSPFFLSSGVHARFRSNCCFFDNVNILYAPTGLTSNRVHNITLLRLFDNNGFVYRKR